MPSLHSFKAAIVANRELMPGVYLMEIERPLSGEPGQFYMVRCSEGWDRPLRRPLALHRQSPRPAFLFKVTGAGTAWLSQKKAGEGLDLLGPLGQGFTLSPSSHRVLLLAGGLGIAPLYLLAHRALQAGMAVTLVLGAKSGDQLYPSGLLPSPLHLHPTTEDGSLGHKGKLTDSLHLLDEDFDQAFAAGPLAMCQALSQHPRLDGLPLQVSIEARLGCGFGACLGCSIPTRKGNKLVCRDGPVFDARELIWQGIRI